jgi:hypothetical protein
MLESWQGVKIGDELIYIGQSDAILMSGFKVGDHIKVASDNHTGFRVINLTNPRAGNGYLYEYYHAAHVGYDDNAAASIHLLNKDPF